MVILQVKPYAVGVQPERVIKIKHARNQIVRIFNKQTGTEDDYGKEVGKISVSVRFRKRLTQSGLSTANIVTELLMIRKMWFINLCCLTKKSNFYFTLLGTIIVRIGWSHLDVKFCDLA